MASAAGALAGISIFRVFSRKQVATGRKVRLSPVEEFPVDSYTLLEGKGLYIYRDHEGIQAVSSVCTHLGCTVQRTEDGFECPCHGSCYSNEGTVLSGPAPSSLSWFEIERLADGSLRVNLDSEKDAAYKYLFS